MVIDVENKRFIFVLKLALIWYLCIFLSGYLTSKTAGVFTDQKQINGVITTGKWENNEPENPDDEMKLDNSKLTFLSNGNQNIKTCKPVSIEMKIKNVGKSDMKRDSIFEVYYIENGNPGKHGEKLKLGKDEGVIPALKQGETTTLTFEASREGRYIFLAIQSSDQYEESVWSKEIKVHCPPTKKEKVNEKMKDKKKQKQEHTEVGTEKNGGTKESVKDPFEDTDEAAESVPDENKENEAIIPTKDDINEESEENEDENP